MSILLVSRFPLFPEGFHPMAAALSLEDQVIVALRRITRAIDLHSRLLHKRYGLTSPQLAALQTIERVQPVSVGSLARHIHLGQATVTGILGRLEKQGYVVRTRDSQDRRSVLVELTSEGNRVVKEAPSPLHDRFREALSLLQEWERTMILATLQRIALMMDAEEIDALPVLEAEVAAISVEDVDYLREAGMAAEVASLSGELSDTATEPEVFRRGITSK